MEIFGCSQPLSNTTFRFSEQNQTYTFSSWMEVPYKKNWSHENQFIIIFRMRAPNRLYRTVASLDSFQLPKKTNLDTWSWGWFCGKRSLCSRSPSRRCRGHGSSPLCVGQHRVAAEKKKLNLEKSGNSHKMVNMAQKLFFINSQIILKATTFSA